MDVADAFRKTGALLDGHFTLRSGLHSRQYFQCALLLQHARLAGEVIGLLAEKVAAAGISYDAIVSPAMGGILVGQELARQLDARHIFTEKEDGKLKMRRFKIKPGERFLVAEDVVTTGSAVRETIDVVRAAGGIPVGVAVIVNRSGTAGVDFGLPLYELLRLQVETFQADALPPDLAAIPATKPGSK
ncbi:MAG: orotate phosphoribosyltransferase [Candidatus Methylacidiphilales bacterium]|nr:orotate phosphoribosyltransferase [Candidatus Methylacidiphilales bacterium]